MFSSNTKNSLLKQHNKKRNALDINLGHFFNTFSHISPKQARAKHVKKPYTSN